MKVTIESNEKTSPKGKEALKAWGEAMKGTNEGQRGEINVIIEE